MTNVTSEQVKSLLSRLRIECNVAAGVEVIADIMPGRLSRQSLGCLLDAGVTKFALHVETTQGRESKALSRACDVGDMSNTMQVFEQEGFWEYGLELALGLAGQTPESYRMTLSEAVFYAPKWIELYTKTAKTKSGALPSQKALTAMYEHTQKLLASCHYSAVTDELFCLAGHMLTGPVHEAANGCVVGFGAGAFSFLDDIVFQNVADAGAYIDAGGEAEATIAAGGMLGPYEQELRAFNQRLHLTGGIEASQVSEAVIPDIEIALQAGLLSLVDGRYRRTAAAVAAGREFVG